MSLVCFSQHDSLKSPAKPGLYALTPDFDFSLVLEQCTELMESSLLSVLQLRRKEVSARVRLAEAVALKELCATHGVTLVINDDTDLAFEVQAGVHLGQGDGSLARARERLGEKALIGRTCHSSLALAEQAAHEGASYVAFGAYRSSQTKPGADVLPDGFVEKITTHQAPVCLIGGMVPRDTKLLGGSVRWVAASSSVFANEPSVFALQMSAWRHALSEHLSVQV